MATFSFPITCLLLLVTLSQAVNPGVRCRFSQFGLNYLGSEALKSLAEQVKDTPIPDQSGEDHTDVGKLKWTLKNMKVTSFGAGQSQVSTVPDKSLGLSVTDMSIAIHGEFKYEIKVLIPIRDSGSFDVSMSLISASVQVTFGLKEDGHLTMAMSGCTSDIGSAKVTFHGGAASIYNFFSDKIASYLKGIFNPKICDALGDVINQQGDTALQKQKLNVSLGSDMMMDLTYMSPLLVNTSFIQGDLNGEVFWEPKRAASPLVAPPLPAAADETKMVNIWLSSYSFNTMGQVAHEHQLINSTVDQSLLADDKKYMLNTTCPTKICIGSAIPKLGSTFPDSTVVIPVTTMNAPYVNITTGNFAMTLDLRLQFDVILPNASRAHAFTVESVITFNIQPLIIQSNVTLKIANGSASAHVIDSSIGNLTDAQLSKAMDLVVESAVIPTANKVFASEGLPLVNGDITLANPRIVMAKDALLVNTDIIYKPQAAAVPAAAVQTAGQAAAEKYKPDDKNDFNQILKVI